MKKTAPYLTYVGSRIEAEHAGAMILNIKDIKINDIVVLAFRRIGGVRFFIEKCINIDEEYIHFTNWRFRFDRIRHDGVLINLNNSWTFHKPIDIETTE